MALLDLPQKAWLYNSANILDAIRKGADSVFIMNPADGVQTNQSMAPFWDRVGASQEYLTAVTSAAFDGAKAGAEAAGG